MGLRAPGERAPDEDSGRSDAPSDEVAATAAAGGASYRPRSRHDLRPGQRAGPGAQNDQGPSPQDHREGGRETRRRGPGDEDTRRGTAQARPGGRARENGGRR